MKLERLVMTILIFAFISAGLTGLFYSLYVIRDVREIPMSLEVGKVVGLDIDSDELSFGVIPQEGVSVRNITLKNNKDVPLKVELFVEGDISQFIAAESLFWLQPGEEKNLGVIATIPKDGKYGTYSGKMTVFFKRMWKYLK